MTTLHEREEEAKKNLLEYFKQPDGTLEFGPYPGDNIHEVADSLVPVYHSELLKLASDNWHLLTDVPELGPAFDGEPTPINIIAANVYEHLERVLYSYLQTLRDEEE